MSRRVEVTRLAMLATLAASLGAAAVNGCAATGGQVEFTGGASSASGSTAQSGTSGTGGVQSTSSAGGSIGVGGFNLGDSDGGDASDATGDVTAPCGSKCGPTELCDPAHLGYDDNCNGLVDEGCSCSPGAIHWCFEGPPSFRNTPGCFDGIETCSELGMWGPCVGGVQGWPMGNACYENNTMACHAISALPYATTDLKTGTGNFSLNAVVGSEKYAVQCPMGVSQCPAVMPPESFQAIQSGEYTVTYTKMVAGSANPVSCTFPLFVGAQGLRVELSWNHPPAIGMSGADLDLHVHEPVNTSPWSVMGQSQDCTWSSCKFDQISIGSFSAPHWFPDNNVLPMPVNWDLDPVAMNNTCYNDLHGVGGEWAQLHMGCHNPRLDIDQIQCDLSITDPQNANFCTPENVNIDYPPNQQWVRVGVHYYFNHYVTYDVHPEIKIFCNGGLSADLGPHSYYVPEQQVTFEPADGAGTGQGNRFWIAGDVAFTTDACGVTSCVVQPIYSDPANKTPLLTLDTGAISTFLPAWPPPP
jgi:hypothetical protein